MAAMTNFAENKLVDYLFRGQASGIPATWYIALVTSNGDEATPGTEVSGGAYARVGIAASLANFAGTQGTGTTAASSGTNATTSNNAAITFPVPTANWGSIVGMEIWDALTGGNRWFYGALGSPKTVNNGDPAPSFAAGSLTYQLDN